MEIVSGSVINKKAEQQIVTGDLNSTSGNSKVKVDGDKSVYQSSSEELGKQEFLNLLITSLRYQNPMDPASNESFVAQMAQFAALEATQKMNTTIKSMALSLEKLIDHQTAAANTMSGAASTNLLGKTVRMDTSEFDYLGSDVIVNVHVNSGEHGFLSVVNEDNDVVNLIALVDKNGNTEGDLIGEWNGLTAEGNEAPLGRYHFMVTSRDGSRDVGYVYEENMVTGITYDSRGTLLTVGEKERPFEDIVYVSSKSTDNNSETNKGTIENKSLDDNVVKVDSQIFSPRD